MKYTKHKIEQDNVLGKLGEERRYLNNESTNSTKSKINCKSRISNTLYKRGWGHGLHRTYISA